METENVTWLCVRRTSTEKLFGWAGGSERRRTINEERTQRHQFYEINFLMTRSIPLIVELKIEHKLNWIRGTIRLNEGCCCD